MKRLLLAGAAFYFLSVSVAHADTVIWSENTSTAPEIHPAQDMNAATNRVANRIFAEAERAVLQEYLGVSNQQQTNIVVIDTGNDEGRYYRHRDNDDEDHEHGRGRGHRKHHRHGDDEREHEGRGHSHWKESRAWDDLPPGIRKQLVVRGHMPKGIRYHALPMSVQQHLPSCPRGTERVIVGRNVILFDRKSGMILDIVRGG